MKTSRLKRVRREEKERNKTVSVRRWKLTAAICALVMLVSLAFFGVDLIRVKQCGLPPMFCVPVIEYENGSEDYYGLFYKVWKDYNPFEDETHYFMGFWFLPKNFNI